MSKLCEGPGCSNPLTGIQRRFCGSRCQSAGWRKANPEKAREKDAKYRKANPEKARESGRKYQKSNPEKMRQKDHRRRARKNGSSPDKIPASWFSEQFVLQKGLCCYCECAMTHSKGPQEAQEEHVIPLVRGGKHTLDNLVLACRTCNLSKGDKLLDEWLADTGRGR